MGAPCSVHYRKGARVDVGDAGRFTCNEDEIQRRSPVVAALAPSTVPALGSVPPVVPDVGLAPGAPVLPLVIEPLELPDTLVPTLVPVPSALFVVVPHPASAAQEASIMAVVNRFMVILSG